MGFPGPEPQGGLGDRWQNHAFWRFLGSIWEHFWYLSRHIMDPAPIFGVSSLGAHHFRAYTQGGLLVSIVFGDFGSEKHTSGSRKGILR